MKFFDLPLSKSLVSWARASQSKTAMQDGYAGYFLGTKYPSSKADKLLGEVLEDWQLGDVKRKAQEIYSWSTEAGSVHRVQPLKMDKSGKGPQSLLGRSLFAAWVELGGLWAAKVPEGAKVSVHLLGLKDVEIRGLLCGFELGRYRFRDCGLKKKTSPWALHVKDCGPEKAVSAEIAKGQNLGMANNLARHLINTPPNVLQPTSFAQELSKAFKDFPQVKVEVWNRARLEKEKMGLHLAVGQGSAHEPCLVKVSYKPRGAAKAAKPVAFVGKGITFDSGGLDIKPASGMRLMKKDMGGAAALTALAWWVARSQPKVACEFYLAMAENSVGANAFRPSDVLKSRSGLTVEVDNTDAEGRLVLADSLTLAAEGKPQAIVNLATLTGAIKVGLGSDLAGLFSNRDALAKEILQHGFEHGDLCWQMPLYAPMARGLKSTVADMVNCTSGFGGAVTAALFLQKFVGQTPWAHVDIYGWQDKAEGAYAEPGGRAQMVLALSSWLQSLG